MKEELTHIEILLERFFEGQTSNEDEQELYRFFRRDDVPDELAAYKPMMLYFESGLADEPGFSAEEEIVERKDAKTLWDMRTIQDMKMHQDTKTIQDTKMYQDAKTLRLRNLRIFWGSVAASILIVLSASILLMKSADPYAGSYIIRNGVRITDLNVIRPDLEATVQKALLQEQLMEQWLEVQFAQQMQEHNNRILDNIQDENIRREVEEIILTQD